MTNHGYTLKHKATPHKDPKAFGAPLHPAPVSENGRTLVLCFDGSSNEFGEINTNVVKLFSFLEKENPRQHVYYQVSQFYRIDGSGLTALQTGVGTYIGPGITGPIAKWIAKTADLGVAWYLDEHVMGGYRFLQSVWQPDDRICASSPVFISSNLFAYIYRNP